MDYQLLFSVIAGIGVLLFLILRLKIHAFLALLICSMSVGILAGMPAIEILDNIKEGMAGTLGFVATVVGLGALFGAILEKTGGAQNLAAWVLSKTGIDNAPWAMTITGFLVAIPVFFDVAFIIILPMAVAIHKKTKKPLLLYAMPLLAGLAITHSFIPPTPGPVAVANILGANLGWVIVFGFIVGIPTAIVSGPLFAKYISKKISFKSFEPFQLSEEKVVSPPSAPTVLWIIFLPISLIVLDAVFNNILIQKLEINELLLFWVNLLGHPFSALILANLIAWYLLGIKRGVTKMELLNISNKSIYPAGAIILLTGAGGAFKQILVTTGAGAMIAESLSLSFFPPVVFAFVLAGIVRVLQGSATVAMVTAAGITAPLIVDFDLNQMQSALLVIAIASGATIFSHVNDSGFWLVSQYLKMDEKSTFKSWSMMTTIIGFCGLIMTFLLWILISNLEWLTQ